MKKLFLFAVLLAPLAMTAQEVTITDECRMNVSLFHESAKNKQYADALEPWIKVHNECPSASANVFIDGDKIVEWKLSTLAPGSAEFNEWRELLLRLHDERIQYFGTSKKYPRPFILGEKGVDYCTYYPEDEVKEQAYGWLKEAVTALGAQAKIAVVSKFAEVSYYMYKADPARYAEQYIADYQMASDIYAAMASDENNKNAGAAQQYKDNLDQTFAGSGAANCDKLDELYAAAVEAAKGDFETLSKIIKLYREVNCSESDVYFAASAYAHRLQPSAESAVGCAAMSKKKEDWRGAVEYYDQAVSMAENDEDRAEYLFRAASVYYQNLKNYSSARQYLRESLKLKGDQGRCYIMIALMYADSRPYDDPILAKSVYWVAVDKLATAKSVDPSCAEAADKLIRGYRAAFPSTEEIFFHKDLNKGASFTVGGWIGESTTVRSRD